VCFFFSLTFSRFVRGKDDWNDKQKTVQTEPVRELFVCDVIETINQKSIFFVGRARRLGGTPVARAHTHAGRTRADHTHNARTRRAQGADDRRRSLTIPPRARFSNAENRPPPPLRFVLLLLSFVPVRPAPPVAL